MTGFVFESHSKQLSFFVASTCWFLVRHLDGVFEICHILLLPSPRKLSDGLFLRECTSVAEGYPSIEFNSMIIDNCCMQVRGGGGGKGGGGGRGGKGGGGGGRGGERK